jgi:hypothetical protein
MLLAQGKHYRMRKIFSLIPLENEAGIPIWWKSMNGEIHETPRKKT